ncbi:MAG: YfcE family phosphodiesterase [Bacteroidetes bacterium]|nr:MAG: YfcE family phosphodiesterase [Bacteroidota bacterium]
MKEFLKNSDEIWHAGDWGSIEVYNDLHKICPIIRGVYGNIDGPKFSTNIPENQIFNCEDVKVLITHIGGYPGRYQSRVRKIILTEKPKLYISGHSHILKVIYDKKYELLHINPGASGKSGFHKVITAIRFQINGDKIESLEIYEQPRN